MANLFCEETKERLRELLGTKFVGFLLCGGALVGGLVATRITSGDFVQGVVWLFGIFAGGNTLTGVSHAVKEAMIVKKEIVKER